MALEEIVTSRDQITVTSMRPVKQLAHKRKRFQNHAVARDHGIYVFQLTFISISLKPSSASRQEVLPHVLDKKFLSISGGEK